MLTIDHLQLSHDQFHLHNEAPLIFLPGQLHFIKGESGSGKTTLLYILGCVSSNHSFTYTYNGRVIASQKQKEQLRQTEIGFLYQNLVIPEQLTLLENMQMFAMLGGIRLSSQKALDLLNTVDLDKDLHSYPSQLSGGEKQRFILACILSKDPSILIADEPTSALDADHAREMMAIFTRLAHRENKIVIVSTHTSRYDALADVINVIEDGIITQSPTSEPLASTPSKPKTRHIPFSFYRKLTQLQLKRHFKQFSLITCICLLMVTAAHYIIYYGNTLKEQYQSMASTVTEDEIFLISKSNQPLSDEQINDLLGYDEILSMDPLFEMDNPTIQIDGKTIRSDVYGLYPFQGSGVHVDATLNQYIGSDITIQQGNREWTYTIEGEFPVAKQRYYSNGTHAIYIPVDDVLSGEYETLPRYVLNTRPYVYDLLKLKLDVAYPDLELASLMNDIELLNVSLQNHTRFLEKSNIALATITVLILCMISLYQAFGKRQDLCVYIANGLKRLDLFKSELMNQLVQFVINLLISSLFSLLFIFLGNHFLLSFGSIHFDLIYFLGLAFIMLVTMLLPSLLGIYLVVSVSIEKELRSLQ